jgi:hypothetical protein
VTEFYRDNSIVEPRLAGKETVTLKMSFDSHIQEEVLEAYALGRIAESESLGLEEHLLLCRVCQQQLERTDEFVRAFRVAARGLPVDSQPPAHGTVLKAIPVAGFFAGWWSPAPVAAAFALAAMGVVSLAPRPIVLQHMAAVRLDAVRGAGVGPVAVVAAAQGLELELDTKGLDGAAFRVELSDARGRQLWQGPRALPIAGDNVIRASIPRAVSAGQYWVRLYDPADGRLVREYGLRAQ